MCMTEVGAERDDMAGDRTAIVAALLQRADRERVTQIVNARVAPGMHTPELGPVEELQENAMYWYLQATPVLMGQIAEADEALFMGGAE